MTAQKNLVIIGGGFAGTTLARRLDRSLPPDWRVTVSDRVTVCPLLTNRRELVLVFERKARPVTLELIPVP